MIQPGYTPLNVGNNYSNANYGNGVNQFQPQNGNHSDGNGGPNGSMQQQSDSGQQSQQSQQPDYSLAGVLHFLQTEWRRYERDRNEWEIERAEMRARVALLEGERRSVENLKTDLMRRVKMLEFALRQERSKYLASSGGNSSVNTASITPVKHPALQGLEKAASSSGRSSPAHEHANESSHQRTFSTMSSATFNSNMGTVNGLTLAGPGSTLNPSGAMLNRQHTHAKDPKARAKSREYLKQCLQEISYLTSASSLNPLPERPLPDNAANRWAGMTRPKKFMSDTAPPALGAEGAGTMTSGAMRRQRSQDTGRGNAGKASSASNRGLQLFEEPLIERDEENGLPSVLDHDKVSTHEQAGGIAEEDTNAKGLALDKESLINEGHGSGSEQSSTTSSESDPLSTTSSREDDSSQSSIEDEQRVAGGYDDDDERQQITAVFRPGGKKPDSDDWAKLKSVGQKEREKRERERLIDGKGDEVEGENAHAQMQATSKRIAQLMESNGSRTGKSEEEDLANLSLVHDEDIAQHAIETAADSQMWKSKRVLRSHLDAVRAVVFDHHQELSLYSASDDNTIKYWKLDPSTFKQIGSKAPSGGGSADSDPILTLRGHSAAVTCLAISSAKRRLYSGSVDSSILVWKLVDGHDIEPYPPYDKTMELTRLIGHTQAIWDLCLLPTKTEAEGLLASASADGTVKFWVAVDGLPATSSLVLSFDYYGLDPSEEKEKERAGLPPGSLPVPTSIASCMSDLRKVAVSYNNSIVKLFEVETGKEVMQINSNKHYDGTPSTQINKVLTHPTLPILITGHENNYIKFFDIDTGTCTLSMNAHLDSVTCLDMDPSGLTLASGGHDCSVRYWDYDNEKNTAVCVQEITAHRRKSLSAEGLLQVKYHPTAPWFCSAGADGVIRIYG